MRQDSGIEQDKYDCKRLAKCRANTIKEVFKHLRYSVVLDSVVELDNGKTTMSVEDWLKQEKAALKGKR